MNFLKRHLLLFIGCALLLCSMLSFSQGHIIRKKDSLPGMHPAPMMSGKNQSGTIYALELFPGQQFTGYYYYFQQSNDSVREGSLAEVPAVSWLKIINPTFFSGSCSEINPVGFSFTAPNAVGVYNTTVVEHNGNWSDLQIILTVTETPQATQYSDTVKIGYLLLFNAEFNWAGFDMGCVTGFTPSATMDVKWYAIPEVPWLEFKPSQFTVSYGTPFDASLTFTPDTPGVYETYRIIERQWSSQPSYRKYRFFVPDTFQVITPQPGTHWVVGEPDTISWVRDTLRNVEIRFSSDGGANYELLTTVSETESLYVWYPPDSRTTSFDCVIKLTDALDPSAEVLSGVFTIRSYDLARPGQNGTMELFLPSFHGWRFANEESSMWPPSWYAQFDYPNIIDAYTGSPYSNSFVLTTRARAEDLPDWQLFAETFGYDKCYSFNTPTQAAMHAWKVLKEPWTGVCFGFPTSSLLAFEQGKSFFSQHPGIPPTSSIYNLFLTNTIRNTVIKYYLYQNDMTQIDHMVVNSQETDVRELISSLKTDLLSDAGNHRTLSMLNNASPRAHTLIPFKLKKDESNPKKFRLLVYDPNTPGDNEVYIELDSLNNTWEEFTGLEYPPASTGLFLNLPINHFLETPLLELLENPPSTGRTNRTTSGTAADRLTLYNTSEGNIFIISPLGDTLGFGNGAFPRNIPGAVPIIPSVAVEHPPIGYTLPDDAYRVTMNGFSSSSVSVLLHDEGTIYVYERDGADSTQTENLSAENGIGVKNSDVQPKDVLLKTIIQSGEAELTFTLAGITVEQNDSVAITEQDRSGIQVSNTGSPKSYHLRVGFLSETANNVFEHSNITLPGNATQYVIPEDSGLFAVKILSDFGSDGSIDDSTVVQNQGTGVHDLQPGGVPAAYAIFQNYPNPFNPSTVIAYSLPAGEHVTLKIYDVLGREIATLVDGMQKAGYKNARWDASAVPGGVYFYRLTAGSFVETKKLILMK